ncbi:MAG: hypothetical protein HWD58_04070 [Bacteroidota bacterium]|nr:MAG: hypothetical protein HWD58_04070 [Bacteroidota bacterium]
MLGLTRTHTRDAPDVFIAFHVILYAAILSVLYYLYIKKVKPIARDIEGRSGIWVDLVITRKNEFPTVGRYYFFLIVTNSSVKKSMRLNIPGIRLAKCITYLVLSTPG